MIYLTKVVEEDAIPNIKSLIHIVKDIYALDINKHARRLQGNKQDQDKERKQEKDAKLSKAGPS